MANEVLCIITDILPITLVEDHSCIGAFFDKVLEVLTAEGRVSTEESVGDYTKRPHIYSFAVAFLQHNFGCCVAKGASHGCENFVFRVKHFGNSKISQDKIRVRCRS
jgi:hypothetical protein